MTRNQLILCAIAFGAVVYLPGVSSRAADDPAVNGRGAAQFVRKAPPVGDSAEVARIAAGAAWHGAR